MKKKQTVSLVCSNCGYRPPKWVGCCPECSEWGSIAEVKQPFGAQASAVARSYSGYVPTNESSPVQKLSAIKTEMQARMLTGIAEWDRVLGGGMMPGSFLIVTGDPGIGKSTLLLQVANKLAERHRVLYVSSEESLEQVRLRAERLGCLNEGLLCSDKAQLEVIATMAQDTKAELLIVDSIQNCYSGQAQIIPGSIGQLRESGFCCMRLAKECNIAILLTGHITKEGTIAGPKMLEHMVDAVFYLQGEDRWQTRILRSVKNRFGPVGELGFFQMQERGLQEVPNINQELLNEASFSPGSVLVSSIEGSRPFLLELQALLVPSKFGIPQRVISGIDQKQVVLIAAILEKYLQLKLNTYDIFFKVSGGFKIKDSSADLGIALALLSNYFQQSLPEQSVALGELSLTGQIKPVNQIGLHVREAEKFGIGKLLLARNQKLDAHAATVLRFKSVYQLLELFGEGNISAVSSHVSVQSASH